tara:strand:+ start:60 stop:470 length:411 start_codon:yes stop_codon:yes gene_type:complete
MHSVPRVGIGVILIKDGKILVGKRKNSLGDGTWSFPGGHLELNESIEECAKRELREETGLELKNILLGPVTNDIFEEEKKHYLTLYLIAEHDSGEPTVLEPDSCSEWKWVDWYNMPKPLFLPLENLLNKGYSPFVD